MNYLLKKILIKNEEISYYIKDNKAKFTIVFIHGYNSSSDFASPLFNLHQNFNIVVLNLPGSLLLKKPQNVLSIDLFISIVKEFITRHLKVSNLILLGHSLGGGVVAPLSQHPKVKKIIYLSTIHSRMNHSDSWKNLNMFYNQTHNKALINDYLKNNPELEEIFDQETLFADLTKKYLLNLEYFETELKAHYLKSLNKKPLFIIGENDYVIETKHFTDFVEQDLKQSIHLIPNVYHSPIKETPDLINKLLNKHIKFKKRWWPSKLINQ